MSRTYHHLSPEDRAVIMIERRNGRSLRSIARLRPFALHGVA